MLDVSGEVPVLAPGTEVSGFVVEESLASGSFGTVYRARRGARLYAVKLVRLDPRGDREAAALRLVRHPNVVSFHGYGFWPEDEPRFMVLALELVEGRTLDVWAGQENPSALELVMRVLLPFALTLVDVHASGVVHRDIKEANIIVREADGQPVLVDFGAAGLKEGAVRLTLRLPPGTPEYRSPEALRFARAWEGEPYPFAPGDDLWALGVVTYILLTRALPFGDRAAPGLNKAILEETPRAPCELNPRVPQALSDVCTALLEKDPEDRYPDAKALAEDLMELCTQADGTWRVPLFPGGRHAPRPGPPAPAVRRRRLPGRWGWWAAAGLVLTAGLLLLVPGVTPRMASSPSPATRQDTSGQGLETTATTAEGAPGAAPKVPTPAPVAAATKSEEPKMKKTIRTLVVAGCVAGSPGCVSGPRTRPLPPPAECPPGAEAELKRFGVYPGNAFGVTLIPQSERPRILPVRDGQKVRAEVVGDWRQLPNRTILEGQLYLGDERVHGRFTSARLPSGEPVPVCLELMTIGDPVLGTSVQPGSTATQALIISTVSVRAVSRFK